MNEGEISQKKENRTNEKKVAGMEDLKGVDLKKHEKHI